MLSGIVIFASGVTMVMFYVTSARYRYIEMLDWSFPRNCTFHLGYITIPYFISMRDSTRLSTNVHIPRNIDNSLPIILVRTPYGKQNIESLAKTYTQKGYIVVAQDTRGFYESEGQKGFPFASDQEDGHDTLKWLETQPWCNGKIGTWGGSALGITQYLLAPKASESLKCQVQVVATPDFYAASYQGGQLRKELILPWMEANGYSADMINYIIQNEKLMSIWDPLRIVHDFEYIKAASLHLGGWFDIFAQGTIDAFTGYQYFGGEGAHGNAKLIMGPWKHGNFYRGPTGEVEFPNQDPKIIENYADAVYEKWLKGDSTLWDRYPTVLFYVMSSLDYNPCKMANRWYFSDEWPVPSNVTNLYLTIREDLERNDLIVIPNDPVINSLYWDWNPTNPTASIGGNNLVIPAGMYDQSLVEDRLDVILFETLELDDPITVIGQMNATLFVSSNCTDTDITVKITDVYPDGRSMLVMDSILRLRNRNNLTDWEFMVPQSIYEITIPLESTAYLFNQGHKIRLAISSSNYPRFEINPNTGDPLWQNSTYYIARNSVFCNTTYPSRIAFPTIDYSILHPFVF